MFSFRGRSVGRFLFETSKATLAEVEQIEATVGFDTESKVIVATEQTQV